MRTNKGMKKRDKSHRRFLVVISILAALGIIICSVSAVEANGETKKRYKYYTSVYIDRDETLWDIASEYASEEYSDFRAYIEEVKEINHLKDDQVQYGSTICVPYYSDEYK